MRAEEAMWVRVQMGNDRGEVVDTMSREVPTPTDAMDLFDYLQHELNEFSVEGESE